MWWYTPLIPALERLGQDDCEFEVSQSYIVIPCLKKKKMKREREREDKQALNVQRKEWITLHGVVRMDAQEKPQP